MDQQGLVNAYEDLGRRVDETLLIQNGDVARLRAQEDEVIAFAAEANRAQNLLTEEDYNTLRESVTTMLDALEDAVATALDDSVRDPISLAQREGQGQCGRPRIEIDVNWLAHASQGLTLKDIANEVGCSSRTVRRRLLEHNLAESAPPVIQTVVQADGTLSKEWHPTGPTRFDLRNEPEELDGLVRDILRRYKKYSLGFVKAALRTRGYRVARDTVQASLIRVRGNYGYLRR